MAASETMALPGAAAVDSSDYRPAKHSGLNHLRKHYGAEDWTGVTQFLSRHPALLSLLVDASPRLNDAFGAGRPVHLRLVAGYEEDEPTLLFADIVTAADPVLALTQMNRFEDDWWLGAMAAAEGLLHFSVEFA